MKRRTLLGSVGSIASLGTIGYTSRDAVDSIDVRFWLSDRAAAYDGVAERVTEYLSFAFDLEFWDVDVSYGGVVDVETENGYDVTSNGEWPAKLLGGYARREVEPVGDVNLLVTDGQMHTTPTGIGYPHVASVGGARHIASLPPIDPDSAVVPYSTPHRVMQVVVHEAGHALGLDHDHGVAYNRDGATVATPMLSAYAWSPDYDGDRSSCGVAYADVHQANRKLSYSFSGCARRTLREYSGGYTP